MSACPRGGKLIAAHQRQRPLVLSKEQLLFADRIAVSAFELLAGPIA